MESKTAEIEPEIKTCPICNAQTQSSFNITPINLNFLTERLNEDTLDEAISLARIAWNNFPSLRLSEESKALISELLKSLQEELNRILTPIDLTSKAATTLMEKLDRIAEKLPEEVKEEFEVTRKQLAENLKTIQETTAKSSEPVHKEIKELNTVINQLIYKPASKGKVTEKTFAEAWQESFMRDKITIKGGAGKADLLVVPFLALDGAKYGQKITVERKTGKQKYSAEHYEQTINHAKKEGAPYTMLVYDEANNLPEMQRPLYIAVEEDIILAITELESGSWKTAREIFEVFQAMLPETEKANEIDLAKIQAIIEEMQKINALIENLRKHSNSAIANCEKIRDGILDLEEAIAKHQQKLKDLLKTEGKGI